jgi:transposase-like protein
MLIFGHRHLERALGEYVLHYNRHRPHRALGQTPPLAPGQPSRPSPDARVVRHDRLGGVLHEYAQDRDVEELLAERGVEVDCVTVSRWVQRFTPLLADAARPWRHLVGDRWQVDETYVKVAGQWRSVYRAVDRFGQVVDVLVSRRRDAKAARRFFERAVGVTKVTPVEVSTDQAPVYPAVLEALLPAAWHRTDRSSANNGVECDHGRLKARLRPLRGLKQDRSARVVTAGHALVQNVRRGHYELAAGEPANRRVAVAFDELAIMI